MDYFCAKVMNNSYFYTLQTIVFACSMAMNVLGEI